MFTSSRRCGNDRPLRDGGAVIAGQAEDETAAINMAAGANFTAVRAVTATSGGGFALMSECGPCRFRGDAQRCN